MNDVKNIDKHKKMAYSRAMDVNGILSQIGLEEKEARIYLALLSLKEATVLQVAKSSGVKRPTAYVILNQLSARGLVSKVIKSKKTFYIPDHPKKLVTETELKLAALKESLPLLQNLLQESSNKPFVKIYEGRDALDRAYDASFQPNTEVLYMSTIAYSLELFPKTIRKLQYSDKLEGFSTRELVDDSGEGRDYKKNNQSTVRKIKFIPKSLVFDIDIGIFTDTVLITQVKINPFTISIQSKEIATSFRSLFEAMWKLSGD